MTLRIFSDGAGTQSTAVLVLQAQGKIEPYDYFVFANVGDDSEHPAVLRYRREHTIPYAQKHGIPMIEVCYQERGKKVTLLEHVLSDDNKAIAIPVRFQNGAHGKRLCTTHWKIAVIDRFIRAELKKRGEKQCVLGIGFSVDEGGRRWQKYPDWHTHVMSRNPDETWKKGRAIGYERKYEYPLVEKQLSRFEAIRVVCEAGLPPPPPSLCWFCPFTPRGEWINRKATVSKLYERAVELEAAINEKRARLRGAGDDVRLHPDGIPLQELPLQYTLADRFFDDDGKCEEGVCGL